MTNLKLKIKEKLQLYILVTSGLVFLIAIGIITYRSYKNSLSDAHEIANSYAENYAEQVSGIFNQDLAVVRTLASSFDIHRNFDSLEWKPVIVDMHRKVFENTPRLYALWDSWEYNYILPDWDLPHGRFLNYHFRENGTIQYDELERSLDGDPDLYGAAKQSGKEMIWEPYPDQLEVGATGTTLMTTFTVPMLDNNEYIGLVGADITLKSLQEMMTSIQPFEGSYAFLVSHGGLFSAHPYTEYLEQSISDYFWSDEQVNSIFKNIEQGERFHFTNFLNNDDFYYTFAPVHVGETGTPWMLGIGVPLSEIRSEARTQLFISLGLGLLGFLVIFWVVWVLADRISGNLNKITHLTEKLAKGEIDKSMQLHIESGDEFQDMAEAFNTSVSGLSEKEEFAGKIGNGELDTELNLLSDKDSLGKSLREMQENLQKARIEEQKRIEENKIRNWATEGYAKFADILRNNNDNMEELSFQVIKNMVKYLNANQGGIFILEEQNEEEVLNLKACYAFDRKKYMEKTVLPGEGMVGTCYLEGKTTYMTQIPQSYIRITSGLGGENPGALIIVPLKLNDQIFGVMEIASFNEFEKYQIEFLEKIAESVASTISTVKINLQTASLLEKSQQQGEEMKAQEEEMRQNMEELSATQEEMARKTSEMEGILNALDASSYVIEYDLDGKIINISDSYLELLKLSKNQVLGTKHADNMELTDEQKNNYQNFWNQIKNGATKSQESKINIQGQIYWLAETYTPIRDDKGNVFKIFKIANNITFSKSQAEKLEKENEKLQQEINKLKSKK
ncbi:MAG: GAF domain-containing protein [Bacteroidales bacterium]